MLFIAISQPQSQVQKPTLRFRPPQTEHRPWRAADRCGAYCVTYWHRGDTRWPNSRSSTCIAISWPPEIKEMSRRHAPARIALGFGTWATLPPLGAPLRLPELRLGPGSSHFTNWRFVARAARGHIWAWGACFSRRRVCVQPTYAPSGRGGGTGSGPVFPWLSIVAIYSARGAAKAKARSQANRQKHRRI